MIPQDCQMSLIDCKPQLHCYMIPLPPCLPRNSTQMSDQLISGSQPCCRQVSAGGSLSNTLLAMARLGAAEDGLHGRGRLRVAMDGVVGRDALSQFYSAQMATAGVAVLAQPGPNSSTGEPATLSWFF